MQFFLIARYFSYIDAHIALGVLEENDINAHLRDEHTITIDPILANANGGIKLMVAEPHVERAIELLQNVNGEKA